MMATKPSRTRPRHSIAPGFWVSFLIVSSALAQAPKLPAAPKGFHWEPAPEIKAAFLTPDGWFFRKERKESTHAYFVTREDIAKTGEFLVGFSVNAITHLQGKDAVGYSKDFIASYSGGKKLLKSWEVKEGPLLGSGCLVEDETTTMHALALGNPQTNTLYIFIFEAPKREWPEAWKLGRQIVDILILDNEI